MLRFNAVTFLFSMHDDVFFLGGGFQELHRCSGTLNVTFNDNVKTVIYMNDDLVIVDLKTEMKASSFSS